jgi:hypothetical protein
VSLETFVALSDPRARPLHFTGLEIAVAAAFAITLRDALLRARAGERHAIFQWLVALFYGVWMELIAFNYLDNYDHARFTVELYREKLPLYVVCLYPVLHYTGLRVVARWRLGPVREALLAGFAMFLIDVPFDIAGVHAGWWRWSGSDPTLAVRWLGVPVTSYYWYLAFGAVYALLTRAAKARVDRRAGWLLLAPVAALGVIVGGALAFLPFHALHAVGVPESAIVALHLAGCSALALSSTPGPRTGVASRDGLAVTAIPFVLGAFHLLVIVALVAGGGTTDGGRSLLAASAAVLGAAILVLRPLLPRGRAVTLVPAPAAELPRGEGSS